MDIRLCLSPNPTKHKKTVCRPHVYGALGSDYTQPTVQSLICSVNLQQKKGAVKRQPQKVLKYPHDTFNIIHKFAVKSNYEKN